MSNLLRRIVVPVDFSETSDHALRTACSYAVETGAEICLVHVLRTTDYVLGSGVFLWTEDMMKAAQAGAAQAVEARASLFRDAKVTYRTEILNGIPEDEIVRYAAAVNASVIIMGTHGRTGLARIAMGSVAQRVVEHASCPVLMVRFPTTKK